ncbi:hypothetical protein [Mucilaginibacter pedocola]|uniref:Uncharacterized protein n=1 Tax=Mucilaginibacter pedocola TaxID=1792845 RepID=A0A1S9PHM5_9SPHI|nr:hypothetical protein [Mucilaginibacter pedocola]OOQ60453.1 hypothetical protein BC343_24460 [Mucilaginibacter pedocola]
MSNLTDETGATAMVLGAILIGFSRLKNENNLTHQLRLHSLYWSVIVVCTITAGCMCLLAIVSAMPESIKQLLPDSVFFFLFELNFATLLFVFVIRFYYVLSNKTNSVKLNLLPYKPYNIIAKTGILLFAIFISVAIIFDIPYSSFSDNFIALLPFVVLLIASKEKEEPNDSTRLTAMTFGVFINAVLVLTFTWVLYGLQYWDALVYLMVSLQTVFFIIYYAMRFFRSKAPIQTTLA